MIHVHDSLTIRSLVHTSFASNQNVIQPSWSPFEKEEVKKEWVSVSSEAPPHHSVRADLVSGWVGVVSHHLANIID